MKNIRKNKKGNSTAIVAVAIIAVLAIIIIAFAVSAESTNKEKQSIEDRSTIILTVKSNNLLRSSYDIYFDGVKVETVQIEQNGTYTTSKIYTWQKSDYSTKSYTVKVHQYNAFGQEDDQRTIQIQRGQTYNVTLTA
jgi:hypothetical protein